MRLRDCEWKQACVWDKGYNSERERYRIGNKKATFLAKTKEGRDWYSCEGCARQITEAGYGWIIKIIPLTKKAEQVLILLKLE